MTNLSVKKKFFYSKAKKEIPGTIVYQNCTIGTVCVEEPEPPVAEHGLLVSSASLLHE